MNFVETHCIPKFPFTVVKHDLMDSPSSSAIFHTCNHRSEHTKALTALVFFIT
jgi:hypothetical protein